MEIAISTRHLSINKSGGQQLGLPRDVYIQWQLCRDVERTVCSNAISSLRPPLISTTYVIPFVRSKDYFFFGIDWGLIFLVDWYQHLIHSIFMWNYLVVEKFTDWMNGKFVSARNYSKSLHWFQMNEPTFIETILKKNIQRLSTVCFESVENSTVAFV